MKLPCFCVMPSFALTPSVPVVTISASSMPLLSPKATSAPLAVIVLLKSFEASASAMFLPVALIPVVPVTSMVPLCNTSPLLVTPRFPPTVVTPKLVSPPFVVLVVRLFVILPLTTRLPPAFRSLLPVVVNEAVKLFASARVTSAPLAATMLLKSFDTLPRAMFPLVEVSVLTPPALMILPAVCVMLFNADTPKVPVVVTAPSSMPFASARVRSAPLAATVLWKSFAALPSEILPLVEVRVLTPPTLMILPAVCVMLFTADTPKVPVEVTSPSSRPFVSARLTFTPLADTVPRKSFDASNRVMLLPAALMPVVPVTAIAPV